MYSDIQILIKGYIWNAGLINSDITKVSFFNYKQRQSPYSLLYSDFTNELDVTNYIILDTLSTINFQKEDMTTEDVVPSLYKISSNVSFQLDNIKYFTTTINGISGNYNIEDFLRLNYNTTFLKYLCTIKYKNKTIYQGSINPNEIKQTLSTSNDSERIPIIVQGFEKEFKEYFSNIKISELYDNIAWEQMPSAKMNGVRWRYENNNVYQSSYYIPLDSLLNYFFNVTNPTGWCCAVLNHTHYGILGITEGGIDEIFNHYHNTDLRSTTPIVIKRPVRTVGNAGATYKRVTFTNGLKRISDDGENLWNWINKVCNAYGWTFSIEIFDNNTPVKSFIVIKNRYMTNNVLYTITDSNLLSPMIKEKNNYERDIYTIIIPNGRWDVGATIYANWKYLNGTKAIVINKNNPSFYLNDMFGLYNTWWSAEYVNYLGKINNDETYKHYIPLYNVTIDNGIKYITSSYNTLMINAGQSDIPCGFNTLGFAVGEDWDIWDEGVDHNIANNEIHMRGNYGNCIGYIDVLSGKVMTYREWIKGTVVLDDYNLQENYINIFKNNFECLLGKYSSFQPEILINEVITNFNTRIKFNHTDNIYGTELFSIKEIELDLINDTTKMNLIGIPQ